MAESIRIAVIGLGREQKQAFYYGKFRSVPGSPPPSKSLETNTKSGLRKVLEPTPGFEPGTFSLPSDLWTLANSS